MGKQLIEIEAARALVLEHARPLGAEPVEVGAALGRVLAEDVTSADPVPGFDSSAMDGFAVRASDTAGAGSEPVRLALVGESRAGHPASRELSAGEAIAISTGAMIPTGADAVVRVEDTDPGKGEVAIEVEVEAGRDIRRAGEDIAEGSIVLETGTEIGPAVLGVLVSVGRHEVRCARRPRATVLTTGDELVEPGEPLKPGAIRNSNAYTLAAEARRAGALVETSAGVPDDREATEAAFAHGLGGDLLVVSGGVSVGAHDHVRPALETLGVRQVFWGVALRPGKPTYFGLAPRNDVAERTASEEPPPCLVFGLPGNPVSAMVTFRLFARPALRVMLGAAAASRRVTAILDVECPKSPGRAHLVRCRLELRDDGWHATPTGPQGSHVLTSMLGADAMAILPTESGTVAAGERVEIELLD